MKHYYPPVYENGELIIPKDIERRRKESKDYGYKGTTLCGKEDVPWLEPFYEYAYFLTPAEMYYIKNCRIPAHIDLCQECLNHPKVLLHLLKNISEL